MIGILLSLIILNECGCVVANASHSIGKLFLHNLVKAYLSFCSYIIKDFMLEANHYHCIKCHIRCFVFEASSVAVAGLALLKPTFVCATNMYYLRFRSSPRLYIYFLSRLATRVCTRCEKFAVQLLCYCKESWLYLESREIFNRMMATILLPLSTTKSIKRLQ